MIDYKLLFDKVVDWRLITYVDMIERYTNIISIEKEKKKNEWYLRFYLVPVFENYS